MRVNLRSLVGKLNDPTRGALEAAAGLCLSRTHYDVEIEHYLLKLLEVQGSDFELILKHFGVNRARLSAELTRSLDKLKSGNARTPAFSPTLVRMLTEAWTAGSIDFGAARIRSGYTILALVITDDLSRMLKEVSREFHLITPEALRENLLQIISKSREGEAEAAEAPAPAEGVARTGGKTPMLDQFT
jgi:type VI secretion system protein VasG